MMNRNNIKILRVERNLSQEELASQIHVHQTAVSQWENGKTNPDMQTADKLAVFFDVSVDFLLGRSKERSSSYHASNIHSPFIQGNGSITFDEVRLTKEEAEILRIYRQSDVRARAKLLNAALELDGENMSQEGEQV